MGILDITSGEARFRRYFAADREQADIQDALPPPSLTKAADAIYALGATRMGKRSVKP